MSIPCKMRPAGLESLPMGYTRLDFLGSTGTSFIDTGIVPTNETGLSITAIPTSNTDTIPFGSRNNNNTNSRFYAVRPRRLYEEGNNIVITNGYGWGNWNLIGINEIPDGALLIQKEKTYLNWFNNRKAISPQGEKELGLLPFTPELSLYLFAANVGDSAQLYYIGNIWHAAVSVGTQLKANFIPVLDTIGRPCMLDTVSMQSFYNQGTGQFIAGLTMGQARNLANLPAPTTINTLTISLPKEATIEQYNQEVNAAIAAAEAKGWSIDVQYRDEFEDAVLRNKYKYAECTNMADVLAVNPDYKNDLTEDGAWIYPLPEMVRADGFMQKNTKLEVFEQDLPKLTVGDAWFDMSGLKRFKGDISKMSSASSMFSGTKLKYPEDFDANISSLSWGNNMFGSLEMSKDLALKIIDLLPVAPKPNTSRITLGIHSDFKYDTELLEAIDQIDITKSGDEGKKWLVTIQWNGTPTAQSVSTFGLRRPSIYAKLGTMERPDGTAENFLDWGHYVTNWEEHGYQEFASLEEAYEHFNLEMPAVEEYSR